MLNIELQHPVALRRIGLWYNFPVYMQVFPLLLFVVNVYTAGGKKSIPKARTKYAICIGHQVFAPYLNSHLHN
jgi:hypothetical protein